MTSAPSEASRRAMLRPMRLAAPVTSATFPVSGASDTSSLSFAGCQTSYTFRRLFFSFSNKPSEFSVLNSERRVTENTKIHREPQRNQPFLFPPPAPLPFSHFGDAGGGR